MATLIVEDGTGLVNANAYCTVDEATEILETNIHSTWTTLDEDTQTKLIIYATRVLEERVKWFGYKMHKTAWLAWPRRGVRDKEGFAINDNIVPRQVKIATALLANHLIAEDPELVNTASNLTSLKADVVELKFDARLYIRKYPIELGLALAGLGYANFGRGGPKFIIMH